MKSRKMEFVALLLVLVFTLSCSSAFAKVERFSLATGGVAE
ncbi:unnamed protein product [marine sediment metagenome]|uniref:Uncharacterized protein n=1 Tax=marine sediment metagenome TaxID=412755 RepID=X1SWD8_9ZZZZ